MSTKSKAPIEVRLLGGFSIKAGEKTLALTSRPAQSLFAYLMINAGTAFRREKLAGMLWPDSTEEAARDYLRHALWRIRKELQEAGASSALKADDISIGVEPSRSLWLDCAVLRDAANRDHADSLIPAISVYAGELLPGFYDEWVVLEREHMRALFEREMERLLGLLQSTGRWKDVLEWAERWIAFGQKPEPAYRALMSAHAANGDMSKVAAAYERCQKTLGEFGVEPSEQTKALYEDIKAGRLSTAGPAAGESRQPTALLMNNIPVPLTSFVGRDRELKKIGELLSASRLVTLTGPGGVGKTRLAIEAARAAAKDFRDGTFWVGLSSLSDENLIPQEIAQAISVREAPGEPLLTTLVRHLQGKDALLVMDNCEHLIHACARIAEALLGACPELRVLATSLEGLGLFNETTWQVPSLPLPEAGARERGSAGAQLKNLREIESIRLFEERARNANSAFILKEQNAGDVAQICQRLDGIPLAIELAAARIKVLSVQEIAARLDDRFSLLTAGSRTAIARHQTLRATIDWSHDLLTEPERALFRRLAVFAGGFTLAAVESVCGEDLPGGSVLDLMGRLVDKSLVIVDPLVQSVETRYRQLETIRQYALEKLLAAGEGPGMRGRHMDFYLRLAEESEARVFGSEAGVWFRRLDRELDNIRSAIEWATATGNAELALRILGALVYFWFAHGLSGSEWNDLIQAALKRPEGKKRTLARAKALNGIGYMYWADMYPMERRGDLEEALSIGRELADPWSIATALRSLGLFETMQGNYEAARALLGESLDIWRNTGSDRTLGAAITLTFLGDLSLQQNEAGRAREYYEDAVGQLTEPSDINFQAYAVRRLAQLAWRAGEYATAFDLCKKSLVLNQEVGDPRGLSACLAGFAAIAVCKKQYEAGAILAAVVEAQLAAWGIRLLYLDRMEYEHSLTELRAQLDSRKLDRLWEKGRRMTLEQAAVFALEGGNTAS